MKEEHALDKDTHETVVTVKRGNAEHHLLVREGRRGPRNYHYNLKLNSELQAAPEEVYAVLTDPDATGFRYGMQACKQPSWSPWGSSSSALGGSMRSRASSNVCTLNVQEHQGVHTQRNTGGELWPHLTPKTYHLSCMCLPTRLLQIVAALRCCSVLSVILCIC